MAASLHLSKLSTARHIRHNFNGYGQWPVFRGSRCTLEEDEKKSQDSGNQAVDEKVLCIVQIDLVLFSLKRFLKISHKFYNKM